MRKMINKFNVWQRIWIVLSVLHLILIIILSNSTWPSSRTIEKDYFDKVFKLIQVTEGKSENFLTSDIISEANHRGLYEKPKNVREELLLAEDWIGLANRAIKKNDNTIDFSKVKQSYELEVRNLNKIKKQRLIKDFLFWLVPVIVLYIFGILLAKLGIHT